MDYRGFMNALKLYGQFGVCECVHIAVKKIQCFYQFLKQIHDSYSWFSWVVCQYPFLVLGNVPFPRSIGLQSTAVFLPCDIAFSPQLIGPGVGTWPKQDHFSPWAFWKGRCGRRKENKREQQRLRKKIRLYFSLGFYTILYNLVRSGSSHVDWETRRERWSK